MRYTKNCTEIIPPASSYIINLSANATIGSAINATFGRARVGHNFPTYVPDTGSPNAFTGPATLDITGGTCTLGGQETGGLFVGLRAGLVIGFNNNGTVNVSGGAL